MLEPEQITPEGLAALRAEIAQLETEGRAEMAVRIKAARELGDLKENAEYHIAKDDQAHLETKIKRLTSACAPRASSRATRDPDVVGFGSTVLVVDEASGREHEFTLVGADRGRPEDRAPVVGVAGRAGARRRARRRRPWRSQTPGGERRYRVERVG